MSSTALLQVLQLSRSYPMPRRSLWQRPPELQALRNVSFSLAAGRSLGIVGESGSGKSTLARLVMALDRPSSGQVLLDGQDLHALAPAALRSARRDFQMVFQDPHGSLDPRLTVARSVAEPLTALGRLHGDEQRQRVLQTLEAVGLGRADLDKYPHQFSGGQRQRIAIARALVTRPRLIVADEPVSALDVSVQAQVLNLLQELQHQHGLSYLLISHDLAVVHQLCHEVAVMQQGRIVELASAEKFFQAPEHPYSRQLLQAAMV